MIRSLIREILLNEGGLKLPPDQRRDLTPQVVREAGKIYLEFVRGFNAWLAERGEAPIDPISPSGSSAHAEKDIIDRPRATYGDIDYLVSFPVDYTSDDPTAMRKEEAAATKKYTDLLTQYLTTARPAEVDVDLTVGGHPLMVIIKVPSGGLAQVDTVVTHPKYAQWMRGRYTPERGIKGYVTGKLYKALGDHFMLTIGTEGVLARMKDGQRVSSRVRSGVTYRPVSSDFRRFLRDIADYLIDGDYKPDPLLVKHPGGDPDNVSLADLARGIVGLARTLEAAGLEDSREMLQDIHQNFVLGLEESVGKKVARDITPAQEEKMRKLNIEQGERVSQIFFGDSP
jgi:hypothetical protein